ncbi:MAG: hypothetical protein R3E79_48750 [Caldilineaceae bacterium]
MHARIATLFSTLLVALLVAGCGFQVVSGSGTVVPEERPVSDFTRVDFTGFGELTLVQGDKEALTIETDDNLLPIKTTVSGDRDILASPPAQLDTDCALTIGLELPVDHKNMIIWISLAPGR